MRLIRFLLQVAVFLAVIGLSLLAIGAFLGFAHPLLDTLNHFQPFWFVGLALTLLVGLLIVRQQPMRSAFIAIGFTGFLASAVIVVPEFVAGLVAEPRPAPDARTYTVMSRNVFGRNYDMERVAADIRAEDPDIIALQEYFVGQRADLHWLITQDYPHFETCTGGRRAVLAIYAKIPFETEPDSFCPNNAAPDSSRIGWLAARFAPDDGMPFTVMTTHLNWPIQVSPLFENGVPVLARIDAMSARKRSEFSTLAGAVENVAGPLVLLGDFNSTPWSYELRRFASQNGLSRQTHNQFTFPTRFHLWEWTDTIPFLPLDHMMTRGLVNVHAIRAGNPAGSDHRPLTAKISVGPREGF